MSENKSWADVAAPIVDLVHRVAAPVADEVGEYLGTVARHHRIMQTVKIIEKTIRMLKDAGLSPQPIAMRIFIPLLESASVEDDDYLQEHWAALLANAASSTETVHPSTIEILRQLTPEDARPLNALFDYCETNKTSNIEKWYPRRLGNPEAPAERENLVRLGLIRVFYEVTELKLGVRVTSFGPFPEARPQDILEEDYLTDFAFSFVRACRAPRKPSI